jgi:hypothetical protein
MVGFHRDGKEEACMKRGISQKGGGPRHGVWAVWGFILGKGESLIMER